MGCQGGESSWGFALSALSRVWGGRLATKWMLAGWSIPLSLPPRRGSQVWPGYSSGFLRTLKNLIIGWQQIQGRSTAPSMLNSPCLAALKWFTLDLFPISSLVLPSDHTNAGHPTVMLELPPSASSREAFARLTPRLL